MRRAFEAPPPATHATVLTEVLHLWHREAERDEESSNRKVVLERAETVVRRR